MSEKLVRDKIPDIIRENNEKPTYRFAKHEEVMKFLKEKLVEEANEYKQSGKDEELADLLEVINAIIAEKDSSMVELEKIRFKKRSERGGFDNKTILEVDQPK